MRQLLKITSIFALALVFTAGMAFAQEDEATVTQKGGNSSNADITQTTGQPNDGNGKEATVLQVGNGHDVSITQSYTGIGSEEDQSFADVIQRVGNAKAEINQSSDGKAYTLKLTQTGNNFADIDQEGPSVISGFFGDRARQRNTGGATGVKNTLVLDFDQGSSNNAGVRQVGQGNEAYATSGGLNTINFRQIGNYNFLDVEAGKNSSVTAEQIGGNENVARLDQEDGSSGNGASATVFQDGFRNRLAGTDGKFTFAKQGAGAELGLTQVGNDNLAEVDQASSDVTNITQRGNSHTATVDQN